MLLAPETAALRQPRLPAGRRAEDRGAPLAGDGGLGVREDGGDGVAAGALHVHEVAVGVLHEPLLLVRAPLFFRRRVEQVYGQRHLRKNTNPR